jgi:N-acyl-D-amino-acid deacylase
MKGIIMANYDLILRNCLLCDGSGKKPGLGELGIKNGLVLDIAPKLDGTALREIDCKGMAVAPGFINLHSWAATDLLSDGRAMSDILQGVTLEVFGESWSEGPLSPPMKEYIKGINGVPEIPWTTLSDFLSMLEMNIGVSVNVASFVGVDNLRYHTIGMDSRPATKEDMAQMAELLEKEMLGGAMGIGSALIYVPGLYFQTHELRKLARMAFQHGGAYISHIRSEGNKFSEALEEFVEICNGGRGILYHFKVQGEKNWNKLAAGLTKIAAAQKSGAEINACVYPYTAGMTSLSSVLPPWAREGGQAGILETIAKPENRGRLIAEMAMDQDEWENLYVLAGGAKGVTVLDLKTEAYQRFNGATLAEVAAHMDVGPEEAILALILAEKGDPTAIFFHANEENLKTILKQPWVCLGSDIGAISKDANKITHPRAFGTFARFIGHYCRDLGLMPLEEGIRRITSLPAKILGIEKSRGYLRPGYAADVVVFDTTAIQDHATYQDPLKYATGVKYVIVNGKLVVEDGEHTGSKPGKFVRGPGYRSG